MSIFRQAMGSCVVCYLCFTMGMMYTWPSSTLTLFASANTTLNRSMTETEVALLGSLSSISALVSIPMSGYLLDALGRKYSCILISLIQVLSWVVVTACYQVEAILGAVFMTGLAGCAILVVPIFISEMCHESVRGMLTSSSILFYGVGMLFSYAMGGYFAYDTINYSFLSLTILGTVLLTSIKESPIHLMRKGLEKEAAEAIVFYRGMKPNSKELQGELEVVRRALHPELDDLTAEEEKMNPVLTEKPEMSILKFLKSSRSSRRALLVSIILYTACIFQGLVVVQVYAEPLFSEAVPSMSGTISSIIFAVVSVLSSFLAAFLVEWVGRRNLMIYASIASGLCCVILGTQIQMHWAPHWITAVVMYIFCVVYTCGAGTVPYVITAEIFLPEIKSFASMVAVEWAYICNFIVLFIFNPFVTAFGLGPLFYIFAVVCFLSSVFCVFFLPETKGLTVDVIQTLFAKKRTQKY